MTVPTVHLPDWECPDCTRRTVYAFAVDEDGAPDGDVQCQNCNWTAHQVFEVRIAFDDEPLDMQSFVQVHDCPLCGAPLAMQENDWTNEDNEFVERWLCPSCGNVEWEPTGVYDEDAE